MAKRYIKLDLNGLTLTLSEFSGEQYPRIYAESGENSRSADGTLTLFGSAYEDPHLWEFSAFVSHYDRDKLNTLYREHKRLRRNLATNFKIKITDTTERYAEIGPTPTRAKAPSPFDDITNPYSGFIAYYAQYWAVFSAPIEYIHKGNRIIAQLSLEETEEKVAP